MVTGGFEDAVQSTESTFAPYFAVNKPRFDPEAIPARRRVLTRCYKLLQNLLQWRKFSGERFGVGRLASRLVDSCMIPVAESGWEVGGEECMRKVCAFYLFLTLSDAVFALQVVKAMPKELLSQSLKTRFNVV